MLGAPAPPAETLALMERAADWQLVTTTPKTLDDQLDAGDLLRRCDGARGYFEEPAFP